VSSIESHFVRFCARESSSSVRLFSRDISRSENYKNCLILACLDSGKKGAKLMLELLEKIQSHEIQQIWILSHLDPKEIDSNVMTYFSSVESYSELMNCDPKGTICLRHVSHRSISRLSQFQVATDFGEDCCWIFRFCSNAFEEILSCFAQASGSSNVMPGLFPILIRPSSVLTALASLSKAHARILLRGTADVSDVLVSVIIFEDTMARQGRNSGLLIIPKALAHGKFFIESLFPDATVNVCKGFLSDFQGRVSVQDIVRFSCHCSTQHWVVVQVRG